MPQGPLSHLLVMTQVQNILLLAVNDSQSKVSNATRHVRLDQNVLGFHVPVCDGRFASVAYDFRVEVRETCCRRVHKTEHLLVI